jgi:hypothetical protein
MEYKKAIQYGFGIGVPILFLISFYIVGMQDLKDAFYLFSYIVMVIGIFFFSAVFFILMCAIITFIASYFMGK